MTKIKRLVAVTVAILMILGSMSIAASAWDANVNDSMDISFTTKIFREVNGQWLETTKVEPGEAVKARVYVDTGYYTHSGNLLLFYNTDFFTDSYGSAVTPLTVNNHYTAAPYAITGNFYSAASGSTVESAQVAAGNISQAYADSHNFFWVSYEFNNDLVQKLDGDYWLCEFDLNVIGTVTNLQNGLFEIVENTVLNTTNPNGTINVPKGQANTSGANVVEMTNWNANVVTANAIVTPFTNLTTITFNANSGTFAGYTGTSYVVEGDLGDALPAIPELSRQNYTFAGWVDALDTTPTAAEAIPTPDTFSGTATYNAFWSEVVVTDNDLSLATKFFRFDEDTSEWIETERVARGETVKARVYLDTSYPAAQGQFMLFYDKEFFGDAYGNAMINIGGTTGTAFNTAAGTDAADASVTGEIVTNATSTQAANRMVANGLIPQSVFDENNYMLVVFRFGSGEISRPLDSATQTEWFIELDLTVLDDATGTGDIFTLQDAFYSPATSATVRYGYGDIHKYGEGEAIGGKSLSMSYWTADITLDSQPVAVDSVITLNGNGGHFDNDTAVITKTLTGYIGDATPEAPVPAMANSTFMGWAPADVAAIAENVVDLPTVMPYEDEEYNAVWNTEVEITFDYDFFNGEDEPEATVFTATAGTPFEPVADPERNGYDFIGWSLDGVTPAELPAVYPGEDTVYYPVWNIKGYVLTHNVLNPETMSFSAVASNNLIFGSEIPRTITNFEHVGYVLSEPYTDITFTNPLPVGATMPASDYNIYYKLTAGSWPVTYEANGGYFNNDPSDTQEVLTAVFGQQIPVPADPVKPHNSFVGWAPTVGEMDAESKTFIAVWDEILYTANYYVDNVLYETYDTEFDASLEYPASPDAPEGYVFVGWRLRATDVLYNINDTVDELATLTMLDETMDFDAVFAPVDNTIIFDAGEGHFGEDENAHTDTVVVPYDSNVSVPDPDPTRTGYDFIGWTETDGGTTPIDDPYVAQGDDTLYAIWEVHTWTVTYVVDGENYAVYEDVAYGDAVAGALQPTDPVIEGHNFDGWTPTIDATMPDNDVTYTAATTAIEYTFVLDAGAGQFTGGFPTSTITGDYGTTITYPDAPTREGYDLQGWVPDGTVNPTTANLVIPMPTTMPADPISYDALWTPRADTAYTVEIYEMNVNGAYPTTPTTVVNLSGVTDTTATYTPIVPAHFTLSTTAPYESVTTGTIVAGDTPLVLTVYLEREQVTITFDGNGGLIAGEATVEQPYYYGATVVAPAAPVYVGYTFMGWNPSVDSTAIATVTYTAQWSEALYTITYYGYENVVVDVDSFRYDAATTLTNVIPGRTGYTFDGWFVSADEGAEAFAAPANMPAENLSAYAQFTANVNNVTFTADDADPAYTQVVTPVSYGDAIVPPVTPPEREGYEFIGWSEDGENVVDDFGTMPDEPKDYIALWDPAAGSYTVNIYMMDATGNYPATPNSHNYTTPAVYTGDTVTLTAGVEYVIPPTGFYLDLASTVSGVIPVTGNLVLNVYIARYRYNLTVIVGETVRQETLYFGAPTNIATPTAPTGYEFAGWVDAVNAAATAPATMPARDVFLKATWNILSFEITYDLNGGNVSGDTADVVDTFDYNEVITGTPVPEREGYTFAGWDTAVPVLMPAEDVSRVAQWTINQYNATFTAPDADNPAYADVVTPFDFDDEIAAPTTDPARTGYTFAGWSADGGATVIDESDPTPYGTMTTAGAEFVAVWTPNADTGFIVRVNYTNTITNAPTTRDTPYTGTTGYTAKIVETAGADANTVYVLFSSIPALNGYELDTADARNTEPTGTIAADGSLVLNVYYVAQMRTATFNANGGQFADASDSKQVTIPFNSLIPEVEEPTRSGYDFTGWDGGLVIGTTRLPADRTFNAQWTEKQVTVTFDAGVGIFNNNPADHTEEFTGAFGSAVTFPEDPARVGYTFGGWSADGTTPVNEATYTVPAEPATLVALWTVNQHTITFYDTNGTDVFLLENVNFGEPVSNYVPSPGNNPTLTDHQFSGWNTLADGTGNSPAAYPTMPDTDLVFYPRFTANDHITYSLETYDMDIYGNYPTTPTSTASFSDGVVGQVRSIEMNYSRVGFVPDATNPNCVLEGTIDNENPLVLKLYYARNQFTVTTYPENGGTALNTYTGVYYNAMTPAIADAPAIDGYEFIGWSYTIGGAIVELPVLVTANINLYANYDIQSYDAIFVAPTANTPYSETISFEFNAIITAPTTDPVRDGYEFAGWAFDGSQTVVDLTNPVPYGRMTSDGAHFHAEWVRTDYTVTFSYPERDATGHLNIANPTPLTYATQDIAFGDPIGFPIAPEQDYYTFVGWFEGSTEWSEGATMPARDLDLVARYERVQVMLMPKNDTCSTMIDRTGNVLGTDINATEFRAQPADTEWYVYGLEYNENIDNVRLENDFIRVQGDGEISYEPIINLNQKMYGTGARIIVTDRVTDEVVEEFIIIIFGDVTGDTRVDAADIASIRYEYRALIWSVPGADYCNYRTIAADIARDTLITVSDFTSIKDVVAQTRDINQQTGKVIAI